MSPLRKDYSKEALKGYLEETFTKYGLKDKISEGEYVILKESSWIWNNGNSKSIGLAAFTAETWAANCKGDYKKMDPYEQIDCMTALWVKGEMGRWDVFCTGIPNDDWRCTSRGLFYKK